MIYNPKINMKLITMNSYFNFENTYTYLPKCFFTLQDIEEVPSPDLVIFNDKLAKSLDINITSNDKKELAKFFSCNFKPMAFSKCVFPNPTPP